jgi:hypothetical protein
MSDRCDKWDFSHPPTQPTPTREKVERNPLVADSKARLIQWARALENLPNGPQCSADLIVAAERLDRADLDAGFYKAQRDAALAQVAGLREALTNIKLLWFNDDSGTRNSRDAFHIATAALVSIEEKK